MKSAGRTCPAYEEPTVSVESQYMPTAATSRPGTAKARGGRRSTSLELMPAERTMPTLTGSEARPAITGLKCRTCCI